jgi:hypothetical protein
MSSCDARGTRTPDPSPQASPFFAQAAAGKWGVVACAVYRKYGQPWTSCCKS